MGRWCLHHFIEVATHLKLIKPDKSSAAKLAQNFRNLIHPGRVARLEQTCDRGTAYSAIGAMEHVIRDLGRPEMGRGTLSAICAAGSGVAYIYLI